MKAIRKLVMVMLSTFLIITFIPMNASSIEVVDTWGSHLRLDDQNISTMIGVDETTALTFAILAHCEGYTTYWGNNMNFPTFNGNGLDVTNLTSLFYSYFWFCDYYNIEWVRFSFADGWSTHISYDAWRDHQTAYFEVFDELLEQAEYRGIHVSLNLAGANNPQWFGFDGTGSVFTHSHIAGTAYAKYIAYITSIINHCDANEFNASIFSYDVYNEPDGDNIHETVWAHNESAFHAWACAVANDTVGLSTHIVEMGTAGLGQLFEWGQTDFNAYTGTTGFDVNTMHRYFSAEDSYLVHDVQAWSNATNKTLIINEVANNANYPVEVWPWFLTQSIAHGTGAIAWMDLVGTTNYPYYGEYPIYELPDDDENPVTPNQTVNATSYVPTSYVPFMVWTFSAVTIFVVFAAIVDSTLGINIFQLTSYFGKRRY